MLLVTYKNRVKNMLHTLLFSCNLRFLGVIGLLLVATATQIKTMGLASQKPPVGKRPTLAASPTARKVTPAKKAKAPKQPQRSFQDILESDPEFMNMDPKQRGDIMGELGKISDSDWKKINRMAGEMQTAIEKMGGEEALKNMSEKELDEFVTSFADHWEAAYPDDFASEKEQDTARAKQEPKKEAKQKKKDEPAPAITKDALLASINAIVKHIDTFFGQAAHIYELSEKIETWSKEGIIVEWGPNAQWNEIKLHIELLQSKLQTIVHPDPKTGKRKYFEYIYENEPLREKITALEKDLAEHVPLVNEKSFGLGEYSKQSQHATKMVLKSLGEALKLFKMNDAINTAIEKHEPLAKEMRESEEKLLKAAQQEAKKKPVIARASATTLSGGPAGSQAPSGAYRDDYYPSYGGGYGYQPSYGSSYGTPERRHHDMGSDKSQNKGATGSHDKEKTKESKEKKEQMDTALAAKINGLFNTFTDEIEEIVDISGNTSIATKVAESTKTIPATPLPEKSVKALKAMTEHVNTASKAADELYNYVSDPKPYEQPLNDKLKTTESTFGSMRKAYNIDKLDEEFEQAQAAETQPSQKLNGARKAHENASTRVEELTKKIEDLRADASDAQAQTDAQEIEDTHLPAAQQQVNDTKQQLDSASQEWQVAHDKVVEAADKRDAAAPKEARDLLDAYKKLERRVKRFAKKSTSPALIKTGNINAPLPPTPQPTSAVTQPATGTEIGSDDPAQEVQ